MTSVSKLGWWGVPLATNLLSFENSQRFTIHIKDKDFLLRKFARVS